MKLSYRVRLTLIALLLVLSTLFTSCDAMTNILSQMETQETTSTEITTPEDIITEDSSPDVTTPDESTPEEITPEETSPEATTPDSEQPEKPPVGTTVGKTCPTISLDIVDSTEKFDIQKETSEGRVVVLNFWYTTCGPCLEELPYFYQMATDYADRVSVAAVHIEQPNVDVTDFILNDSGHPEWNDGKMTIGWDTGMKLINLFNIQACPVTVVINTDGVITDYFVGGLHKDELVAAVEKALGE